MVSLMCTTGQMSIESGDAISWRYFCWKRKLQIFHFENALKQVICRGVPRLDSVWGRNKLGALMFEPKVFRKQMCCIEKSIRDIVGTFRSPPLIRRPHSDSAPQALCPPWPSLRPWSYVLYTRFHQSPLTQDLNVLHKLKKRWLHFRLRLYICFTGASSFNER